MGFVDAIRTCFANYATFSGRASRPEYWWFYLFCFLVAMVGVMLDLMMGNYDPQDPASVPWLTVLISLPLILPSLAAMVRRLHDTDKSGWWYFIAFVPVIGAIILVIFLVLPGTDGENRFGPKPAA